GTILCDLEAGRPVDLLPDREADTLATWLQEHPGVEVISRDRAGPYAVGARQGAPDALQVADRWHLLGNVREALERLLDRKQNKLGEAAKQLIWQPIATAVVPSPAAAEPPPAKPPSGAERRRQSRRQRRLGRYQQVRELHGRGFGIRQIARALRISRRTVR